jgi:predicted signal transduction protein with EAL and GGDEF domain
MSLIKQLWCAIALVMTLALAGSLVASVWSARHYFEQQLQIKNIDNANALALSLSQLEKDPVTMELQISAQFDAGHYRFIRLVSSSSGAVIVERTFAGPPSDAPGWFVRWIPIHADPGIAQVQNGWNQFGTLTLASHDQYVYQALWEETLQLLGYFLVGGVLTGLAGTLALRFITRPLVDVVAQAQAIADRRFLTMVEPRTPELRSVVLAMNAMVVRVKAMFAEEGGRLEVLRQKVNHDAVTGLAGRDYFLASLQEILVDENASSTGVLVLFRLIDIQALNAQFGHVRTDALLKAVASALHGCAVGNAGAHCGRLKGAEFALVIPSPDSVEEIAPNVHAQLVSAFSPFFPGDTPDLFRLGAVQYQRGIQMATLLAQADDALARAGVKGSNAWHLMAYERTHTPVAAEKWRQVLVNAVTYDRLTVSFYPVASTVPGAVVLHQEAMVRLKTEWSNSVLFAGDFMPMAARLNMTGVIDAHVLRLAVDYLRMHPGEVAVNLSAETMLDFYFRGQLLGLLKSEAALCSRLLFEVPEYGVLRHFDAFCDTCKTLQQLGCRVGIEGFGQQFAESAKLADVGVNYVKVHPSYMQGISSNLGRQEFLRGLCHMSHALGISVIALGITSDKKIPLLHSLGFDGVSGPGVI